MLWAAMPSDTTASLLCLAESSPSDGLLRLVTQEHRPVLFKQASRESTPETVAGCDKWIRLFVAGLGRRMNDVLIALGYLQCTRVRGEHRAGGFVHEPDTASIKTDPTMHVGMTVYALKEVHKADYSTALQP